MLDKNSQKNYSVSFLYVKSDALVHLSQWQYWWWFWFAFLWVLYYLLLVRIFKVRQLFFYNRLYTSQKPRGKWGDFLACIVPLIWCFNILLNSNFILRLGEWQAELSLYYLRVKGRQWYWVYKVDSESAKNVINGPKMVGSGKWIYTDNYNTNDNCDSYIESYAKLTSKSLKSVILETSIKNRIWKKIRLIEDAESISQISKKQPEKELTSHVFTINGCKDSSLYFTSKLKINHIQNIMNSDSLVTSETKPLAGAVRSTLEDKTLSSILTEVLTIPNSSLLKKPSYWASAAMGEFIESLGLINRRVVKNYPIFFYKSIINNNMANDKMVNALFNHSEVKTIKSSAPQEYSVLKQKKAKKKKNFDLSNNTNKASTYDKFFVGYNSGSNISLMYAYSYLRHFSEKSSNMNLFEKVYFDQSNDFQLNTSKRLLRVSKSLVFPLNVQVGVITNSFDVIHSWFIPSLGIKLDCVPGRSTHHSLYFSSIGFFYGQCAEICGRYHHHMPIKIAVMPFESFLVWWQHFFCKNFFNQEGKVSYSIKRGLMKSNW